MAGDASILPAALVVLVAVGTVVYARGVWRDVTGGPAFRVGLLQGNIEQSVKWDRRYQTQTLETYERLSRRVAADRPALIVWPETAAAVLSSTGARAGPARPRVRGGDRHSDVDR